MSRPVEHSTAGGPIEVDGAEVDVRADLAAVEPFVAARARAEAVADERRNAVAQVRHDLALLADRVEDYTAQGLRDRLSLYADQLSRSLAAGSVPVATPEPANPTCEHGRTGAHPVDPTATQMFWRDYPLYCPGPVANPAEPVTRCGEKRSQSDAGAHWLNAEQYDSVALCCDEPAGHAGDHRCDEGKPRHDTWPNDDARSEPSVGTGTPDCPNGCVDGRVECWSPGGPCPEPNAAGCETCGSCAHCAVVVGTGTPAETVESMCHWMQGRGNARAESHSDFHYGSPCPYASMAAVLRGEPDPRDVDCDHGGSPGVTSCRYCVPSDPVEELREQRDAYADTLANIAESGDPEDVPAALIARMTLDQQGYLPFGRLRRTEAERDATLARAVDLTAEVARLGQERDNACAMLRRAENESAARGRDLDRYRTAVEQIKDDAQTVIPDQKREWLALWLAQRIAAALGDGA